MPGTAFCELLGELLYELLLVLPDAERTGFLRPALMRSIAGSFPISIWTDDAVSAGRLLSRQSCPSSVSVSFQ